MKQLCIFFLLSVGLTSTGCGTKYSSAHMSASKDQTITANNDHIASNVERIAPASAFTQICGIQPSPTMSRLNGHMSNQQVTQAPPGYEFLEVDKTIKIVGNIGGRYQVAESDWRIAGGAMLSSDFEHVIAYPRSHLVVTHDPDVIKRIEVRKALNEVVWK